MALSAPLSNDLAAGQPSRFGRRSLLGGLGAGATLLALGQITAARPASATGITHAGPLFGLGVASGDADDESVVLWTRLARDPLAGGGMGSQPVRVEWRMARDEAMQRVVQRGSVWATADAAHSLHVVVADLECGRDYWYQFRARGERPNSSAHRSRPTSRRRSCRS
jgi:alkaline phosphatase D